MLFKKSMIIFLTGAAGFIGFHTTQALLERGDEVVAIDSFNDYYDPKIKENRIQNFSGNPKFILYRGNICDEVLMKSIFEKHSIHKICHLAARAGVRYSIEAPLVYEQENIRGTLILLELAKTFEVQNFVFASSSSVYGGNTKTPFSEEDSVDHPISPYAATKKACELLGYTYHHLYHLSVTGLRFFTVYGPWGRPDMALFKFTKSILEKTPIDVYNHGAMKRDFTYIDDIVQGIIASLDTISPYEIFNLGNSNTVDLNYFIECIEKELGEKAMKNYLPLQAGDVPMTYADISKAQKKLNFVPKINIEEGIKRFVQWYKNYYLNV